MAAIEQLVISKAIADRDITEFQSKGVQSKHFGGHYADAWQWLVDHTTTHGSVPTERQFALAHADVGIEDTDGETVSGLTDELFNQYALEAIAEGTEEASKALNADNADEARKALQEALERSLVSANVLRDTDLVQSWQDRYTLYQTRQADDRKYYGIHTGFPTLTELTGGWTQPQFILFVGEPKRGKSMYSLVSARAANEESHKKVLYISFEMGVDEIARRYDALNTNIAVNALNAGNVTTRELDHIRKQLKLRQNLEPFLISEDQHRLTTLSAVRAKIIEHEPDLVFIDGMYMMQAESKRQLDERETLTQITRGSKHLAQEFEIPIVGTTQVLPGKVGNKARKIEAQAIGYTSSFIQDADLILGCELDQDAPNRSIIRIVEGRNVPKDYEIKVKWDWEHMLFSEYGGDFASDNEEDDWDHD